MGLLNKKKKSKKSKGVSDYKLPELPELPDFPSIDSPPGSSSNNADNESLPQLPSFPNNSFGQKFSRDSIKEAVSGEKKVIEDEDDEEDFTLPGLPEAPNKGHEPILKPMVVKPSDEVITRPRVKEFHRDFDSMAPSQSMTEMMEPEQKPFNHERREYASSRVRSGASARTEPVFIRIDKFEESLKVFEKTREQIKEIESLVLHAKNLKVKEDEELTKWEEEIQTIKEQIGKVDREIFSKIE